MSIEKQHSNAWLEESFNATSLEMILYINHIEEEKNFVHSETFWYPKQVCSQQILLPNSISGLKSNIGKSIDRFKMLKKEWHVGFKDFDSSSFGNIKQLPSICRRSGYPSIQKQNRCLCCTHCMDNNCLFRLKESLDVSSIF